MADSVYSSLPGSLQRKIDDSFLKTLKSITPESAGEGAGFIVEDAPLNPDSQIPLDLVPETLQHLNLASNDPEVLYVFKNAAEGWKSTSLDYSTSQTGSATSQLGVSLEDWRSVCSILLENEEGDGDGDEAKMDVDSGEDSDAYQEHESSDEGSNPDDEDFELGPRVRRTRATRPGRRASSSSTSPPPPPSKLTPRQQQACLDTYSLFFPSVPASSLPQQKLMISDIQRAAALLKEKLKADEIMDMLEIFSTSPDKSMNFDDFTRMLITANLV